MLFVGAHRNNFDIPGQSLADQHLLGRSVSQLRTVAGRTGPVGGILQMAAAPALRDHLIGRRIQQQGFYSSLLKPLPHGPETYGSLPRILADLAHQAGAPALQVIVKNWSSMLHQPARGKPGIVELEVSQ